MCAGLCPTYWTTFGIAERNRNGSCPMHEWDHPHVIFPLFAPHGGCWPPKGEKTRPNPGYARMQNMAWIGPRVAEKSLTEQTNKHTVKQIPRPSLERMTGNNLYELLSVVVLFWWRCRYLPEDCTNTVPWFVGYRQVQFAYELKILLSHSWSFEIKLLSKIFYTVGLNMCLSCTTKETFSIEYWRDLEMWVKSHSRSLNIVLIIVSIALSCIVFELFDSE